MAAFNAVRFRVKPGREQEFLEAHKKVETNWAGLQHVNIIKTGDRTYCIIAEWTAAPNRVSLALKACSEKRLEVNAPVFRSSN